MLKKAFADHFFCSNKVTGLFLVMEVNAAYNVLKQCKKYKNLIYSKISNKTRYLLCR